MTHNTVSRIVAAAALATSVAVLHAQNAAVTTNVDVGAGRRAINPAIYGVAYATGSQLLDLNVPLHRYGGNNTSRYNWEINADNRGADWYFESIAESSATAGQRGDDFVINSRGGGAEPMITVPIIEYVAKVGANRAKLASFDNSANETGFYVERAAKAKVLQFARIATLGANLGTYAFTQSAGMWVYRLQAYNSAGVSEYSNNVTLRVR